MRVLTHFQLHWSHDEPDAIELTFRDSDELEFFEYPGQCVPEGDEIAPLEAALNDACAATIVTYGDDDGVSEQWFDAWLFDADGPLGARREQVEAIEMTADLSATDDAALPTFGQAAVGASEITGDLSGVVTSEIGGGGGAGPAQPKSRKKAKKRVGKLREGAGCKQPDQVSGWEAGRLLCVTRNHRATPERQFGRCEYRVRCNDDGSYTLEHFAGNRKDLGVGTHWPTVSDMWWALLAMNESDPRSVSTNKTSPTRHHRMTIKKFFKL